MAEYAGGEVLSGIVDCYPNKIEPAKLMLRPERVNALMGTKISKERIIKILEGIEYGVVDKGTLEVMVPTFTADITREVDLIEEVIRVEGFDSVPDSIHNSGPLFTPPHADDNFYDSSRIALTSLGFDEMYSPGLADTKLLSKVSGDEPQLKVLNPIADDLTVMQNSLFYSLLKAVSHNVSHRNMNLQLFDMGRIYLPGKPPHEEEKIGITITGKAEDHWYDKGRSFDFYDLKGAIDSFLRLSHISAIEYVLTKHFTLNESCSFELRLNNKIIGYAGQIKQKIAKQFDIKQSVYVGFLDFRLLLENIQQDSTYKSLPRFPAAPRDLAVVVDESVEVGSLLEEIKQSGGSLLEKVELFDLFIGQQVGDGKKSIAFSMIYRSREKSLESNEVSKLHKKIADNLNKKFKAQIREA
ncbi:MAG: phenylalanine--tRNA ligase subunit beta [candidate division Zixibacteria bacterium]|nr:phenylalanine--tRNA ligase subunit beta [candidate division Zixibacteria bacterium]